MLIEATTGLPATLSSATSRRITSLANVLPPGLSMRSTTAFICSSKRASRSCPASVSDPIMPGACSPGTISPEAVMKAIRSTGRDCSARVELTLAR